MSELNPMSGETLNLTNENIKKIKEIFPEILTEDQIDFEKLRFMRVCKLFMNIKNVWIIWSNRIPPQR